MQTILIIGANGVLGSAASMFYLQEGYRVKCFVRNRDKAKQLQGAGAELIVGDLTDKESIAPACKNVDNTYKCAWHVRQGQKQISKCRW